MSAAGRLGLKIISGGQTGADRAALDWAMAHGFPHGGWCPKGRKAEDGPIDQRYALRETPGEDYSQRTAWNVRDSDGTVIFSLASSLTGGSKETAELAQQQGKPCLHLSEEAQGSSAPELLREFVRQHGITTLNVAGPRASQAPGVAQFVNKTLAKAFGGAL